MKNIRRSKFCKAPLIAEELAEHKCFKMKDFWVMHGEIWIGNGSGNYFRLPNKT
jgi:hypothetical protein